MTRYQGTYADPVAVVRWCRAWLAGRAVGTLASDYGLTEWDCREVQREIGGWPIPGSRMGWRVVWRLERARSRARRMQGVASE